MFYRRFCTTAAAVLALAAPAWAQAPGARWPSEQERALYCQEVGHLAVRVDTALWRRGQTPVQVLLQEGARPVPPAARPYIVAYTAATNYEPVDVPPRSPEAQWQALTRGMVSRIWHRPAKVNVQRALEAYCLQHAAGILGGVYNASGDIW